MTALADEICEVTLMVQGTNVNEHLVSRGLARKKNLEPVHLEPPAEEFPMVYVSYFERTTAVVVRYMGEEYSEALESLENRMLEVYRHTQYNADEFAINVGGVYATMNQDDEGVSVCRVRVLECRENRVGRRVVNCYLPDHGDTETIDVTRLRWLRDEFRLLPYQAVTFNLQGLEPYSSNRLVLELMVQEMLAMEFAVEYDTNDGTGKTVTLHDAESNRNMNEWLLAQLPDGALSQQLAEPDSTYESDAITVKVLNIRENGIVSVRIPGEGERRYSVLERDLQEEIDKKRYEPLPWDSVRRGERVVAQYVEDDGTATWYRAKIIGVADEQIEVEFVDYGNVSPVLRTQIHSLRQLELGPRLNSLPIQRNDVRLTGLPPSGGEWTPQALDTLGVILDPDEKFELRVDKVTESGVAEVSLYGYTEEKQLFCVNEHLLSEVEELFMPEPSVPTPPQSQSSSQQELGEVGVTPDLVRSAEQIQPVAHSEEVRVVRKQSPAVDENTEALKRLTLELKYYHTRPLPCTVPIVDVGSFMPVHVPWADNPGNFACIPMSSFNDLSDLLENMNDFYRKISIQIVPGHMYAAKFEQQWYRVIIKDLFPDNQKVSAQFVDFGDFHLLSYGDLQPLDGAYQSIPRMAFKARLGGLAPELGIWDRVTCTRLQSLVIDKSLHCLVLDKQHVEDGVVSVDLVRTDSGHDVCITDALIQEGLARPDAVLRG